MAHRPPAPSLHSALSWLLLAGSAVHRAAAIPFPKDDLHAAGYGYLMPRQCAVYCGYDNQYCCEAGSQCFTSDGIAMCTAAGGGGKAFYTTTWTVTQTFTKTYASMIPAATAPSGGDCVPPPGSGQIACGNICCASWQYCAYKGQCVENRSVGGGGGGGGGLGGGYIPTTVVTGGQTITTQFSAPYRVTSGTVTATTDTAVGLSSTAGAVSPGGTSGQLSGGAIAGIVIGTLAGVALLLLLCICCVARGLWHGLLALLGLGGKKKKETVVEEERYTRRASSHARRDHHGSWYGGRPSTVAASRKEKSRGAGLLGLGAALGTLALLLGLRREKKKKAATKTRSDVSSGYWGSSSYTGESPSSMSSDRHTRRSARHSRTASRVTRTTHTHTRVSRAPSARSHRSPR